jgi:hypothetical protein
MSLDESQLQIQRLEQMIADSKMAVDQLKHIIVDVESRLRDMTGNSAAEIGVELSMAERLPDSLSSMGWSGRPRISGAMAAVRE